MPFVIQATRFEHCTHQCSSEKIGSTKFRTLSCCVRSAKTASLLCSSHSNQIYLSTAFKNDSFGFWTLFLSTPVAFFLPFWLKKSFFPTGSFIWTSDFRSGAFRANQSQILQRFSICNIIFVRAEAVAQLEEPSLATPEIHDSNHISGKILSTNCTIKIEKTKIKINEARNGPALKNLKYFFSFWCCWKNHWSRIPGQWLFQPNFAPCSRSKVSFISSLVS